MKIRAGYATIRVSDASRWGNMRSVVPDPLQPDQEAPVGVGLYPELLAASAPSFDQNPAAAYLFHLPSDSSRRVMAQALRTLAALLTGQDAQTVDFLALDWAALRRAHVDSLRAALAQQFAPATANRALSALRGVLKEAWRMGLLPAEDYQRAVDQRPVPASPPPASGRILPDGDILALVNACKADQSPLGVRDAAILGLLYTAGLRRAEVVALDSPHFDPQTAQLTVPGRAPDQPRLFQIHGGALRALLDWWALAACDSGPLFMPMLKPGRIAPRRLSPQAVSDMLAKRAAAAGVPAFSHQDLRRTFLEASRRRPPLGDGITIPMVISIHFPY